MTTLPTSLVRFRGELETAITRELQGAARRQPRLAVRVALAAGAAAAVAAGALTVLPGDPGGRIVEPATAAQRAAAALAAPSGSIVHVVLLVTERGADGSSTTRRQESWQQTAPPYDRRQIVTGADGTAVETATVDGTHQLYDPRSDTIRTSPSAGGSAAAPRAATPQPASGEPFRDQILTLLRSGRLTPSGRSTVGGRETLSFTWHDGQTRYDYTVETGTYRPLRWRISPADPTPAATVTFETYEVVPADEVTLDLTDHHPEARIERQP